MKVVTLKEKINKLTEQYGGINNAGRKLGIDAPYLIRLRDGKNSNPSEVILDTLGLHKITIYVEKE